MLAMSPSGDLHPCAPTLYRFVNGLKQQGERSSTLVVSWPPSVHNTVLFHHGHPHCDAR